MTYDRPDAGSDDNAPNPGSLRRNLDDLMYIGSRVNNLIDEGAYEAAQFVLDNLQGEYKTDDLQAKVATAAAIQIDELRHKAEVGYRDHQGDHHKGIEYSTAIDLLERIQGHCEGQSKYTKPPPVQNEQ